MTLNAKPTCRILIVDDQETIRRSVGSLVATRDGWVVCGQASDGLQAVEQAKLLRPELIIMDVSMPNLNGIDATRIILAEVSASRVLIMSQNDPAILRRQTLEAEAHGFLAKDDLSRDLLRTIERILSVHGPSKSEKAS